jgi:hypothetical protein
MAGIPSEYARDVREALRSVAVAAVTGLVRSLRGGAALSFSQGRS